MESRFIRDFHDVRVHDDSRSHAAARAIGARAFTLGSDVVFGAGESSVSASGRRLLAHELTHVVQQTSGRRGRSSAGGSRSPVRLAAPIGKGVQRKPKLDPARVKFADAQLWAKHPELKGRKLNLAKGDAALREEWWRYYQWGGGSTSRGNCYRYACNDPTRAGKGELHNPFPGGPDPGGHITCAQIMAGAKSAGATPATRDKPCGKGSRKIAGVIQDKSAPRWNDYHWYRQESDGLWTHKRGANVVEHTDASGKPITDPATADRNYPGSKDYDKFCGYLCIPKAVDLDPKP